MKPFCQILTGNALYSQKGHPFSLALSIVLKVSNCHLMKMLSKILLRDTGFSSLHKRLAKSIYLNMLNQKMFPYLSEKQSVHVWTNSKIGWLH